MEQSASTFSASGDPANTASAATATAAAVPLVLLTACGGGGGNPPSAGAVSPVATAPAPAPLPAGPTAAQASRFLAQASMGATREHIAQVQSIGYAAWLDEQIALPASPTRWDYLLSRGYNSIGNKNGEAGADAAIWRKLLSSPDTLRQRVTFALSEILVTSISGLSGGWKAFTAAAFLDLMETEAFGNYRRLLEKVSTSAAMGEYLTYRGNVKFRASTGAMPDENYARELMQLFTIGLVRLDLDGTPRLAGGQQEETYGLDDIAGLARVFTGWNYDLAGGNTDSPDYKRRPMTVTASAHETGTKQFLGKTIAAGASGEESLKQALDTIFAHANVAPFVSRQLIMRLVCSNPSPAYVTRVATVFNNDGTGARGNLGAVVKAILLDNEARSAPQMADQFGKQREPILRLAAWARAFKASSASDAWAVGNTSDPATRLGQSPLRAASVFNFFRPGYVPPNSAVATAGMVAPEFQLTNESSVVGYINFMQTVVSRGVGDVRADYTALLPLADTAQQLLDELNLVLAANQLSTSTLSLLRGAIDSMPAGNDAARTNRIHAALTLVLAAPEFIIQK